MPPSQRQKLLAFEPDSESTPAGPPTAAVSSQHAPHAQLPTDLRDKTVYVIDAHSLIYQVFHAMPDMTGPEGQPVGATHGFVRDILDIWDKYHPDYLFCAFDAPGDTFRHELFEEYKANRAEMPDDLRPQIEQIHRLLDALGVPILTCPSYEADDILATVARQTDNLGGQCVIVSNDKDCRQLISDRVGILNIRKNQFQGAESLEQDWGIRPDQVVDFQSLVGDSVDNVPGVPLIGPKIAGELLRKYGTLEQVFEHADEVAGQKRRENLLAFREQALLSRQLVRLLDEVPIAIPWPAARPGRIDRHAALALCREFGFRRLAERIAAMSSEDIAAGWTADYRTVTTLDELRLLANQMGSVRCLSFDTETTSISPRWAQLVGLSFAWQAGRAYYVPIQAPAGEPQLSERDVLEILRPILESPSLPKIGQNIKYDAIVLRNSGIEMQSLSFDTMVADYLIDPGQRTHDLDDLARRHLNHTNIKIEQLIGSGKSQRRMNEVPVPLITQYAAEDADVSLRLKEVLEPQLADKGLESLFHDLEMPLIEVLAEMEFNGIRIDVPRLAALGVRFAQRLAELEIEIYQLAGREFNIESPKQLATILFDELKLPPQKKTKTGKSTDADVLGDLARLHPLPAKIIEYRQHAKLKSTYVDSLPQLVHPQTGRVHSSFKQDVAATGRLSSTDPNLQNIPVRMEEGREIRSAFLPGEPGWQLLAADYSQIELRVLAHYSGDEALQSAFREDRDIHTQVAAEVYGVPIENVTRAMRRSAKAVNFGVIYGQSPFGLAKALGIEKEEAAEFINRYFTRYAGVAKFIQQTLVDCRKRGYVETILGRRRPVHGVRDVTQLRDPHQRTLPERIAINTVIQGSAADLIKRAMIQVYRRLRAEQRQARLLLQIHDELVFEFPPEERAALEELVVHEMSAAGQLDVPLQVTVKIGANWAACE